jgi:hypothetical protein
MKHGKDFDRVERIWGQGRYYLTDVETATASALWSLGVNTFDIAKKLTEGSKQAIHESAVFNALRLIREERRKEAAV